MTYRDITYEVVNNVARITTNRPRYRNAQSRRLLEELDDAFRCAADDREVHVVALFGAGEHFSGGHDLGTPDEMADRRERPIEDGLRGRFERSRELFVDKTMRWRNIRNRRSPESRATASTAGGSSPALTHTPSPMRFLNELLDRPPHERAFLLLVAGYPSPDAEVPVIGKYPLEELATFVKGRP